MDSISESSTRSDTSMEKKRTFLRLIIHAYICPQSGTQTTDKNYNQTTTQNSCTISQCGLMRIILEHMKNCKILKDCHCKFDINVIKKFFSNFFISSSRMQ